MATVGEGADLTSPAAPAAGDPASLPAPGSALDPSMGPHPTRWPIPIAEFIAGPYLEASDVLLMRQRSSWFARLNRILTRSYFSKAALVFLVPHREQDFNSTFLIEATFSGVDLTDLASFFAAKEHQFVVAVKRLEVPWFEQEERNLVRGFMLQHVHAGYDYGQLLENLVSSLDRSRFVLLRFFLGPARAIRAITKTRDPNKLNRFVGPGFVQWGFVETARFLIGQGLLSEAAMSDVLFHRRLLATHREGMAAEGTAPQFTDEDVLGVTAEDLAKTPKLAWKYAIVDGEVYEIATEAEFKKIIRAAKLRWLRRLRLKRRSPPAGEGSA